MSKAALVSFNVEPKATEDRSPLLVNSDQGAFHFSSTVDRIHEVEGPGKRSLSTSQSLLGNGGDSLARNFCMDIETPHPPAPCSPQIRTKFDLSRNA